MNKFLYRYSPQDIHNLVSQAFLGAVVEYFIRVGVASSSAKDFQDSVQNYHASQWPHVWAHLTRNAGLGAACSDLTCAWATSVRLISYKQAAAEFQTQD